jgi:hypothetical protein
VAAEELDLVTHRTLKHLPHIDVEVAAGIRPDLRAWCSRRRCPREGDGRDRVILGQREEDWRNDAPGVESRPVGADAQRDPRRSLVAPRGAGRIDGPKSRFGIGGGHDGQRSGRPDAGHRVGRPAEERAELVARPRGGQAQCQSGPEAGQIAQAIGEWHLGDTAAT